MSKPFIIAIDGPAASGKGTIARKLAQKYNLAYLDTGLLYRAVGLRVVNAGKSFEDEGAFIAASADIKAKDLEDEALRSDEVGQAASVAGNIQKVRDNLLAFQRDFATNPPDGTKGAVLDGRDIGTVICPDAPFKFFITADLEIRAQRRHKELISRGIHSIYARVLEELRIRDQRDSQRSIAPLAPAKDARVVDTSAIDADKAFEILADHIETLGANPASG